MKISSFNANLSIFNTYHDYPITSTWNKSNTSSSDLWAFWSMILCASLRYTPHRLPDHRSQNKNHVTCFGLPVLSLHQNSHVPFFYTTVIAIITWTQMKCLIKDLKSNRVCQLLLFWKLNVSRPKNHILRF